MCHGIRTAEAGACGGRGGGAVLIVNRSAVQETGREARGEPGGVMSHAPSRGRRVWIDLDNTPHIPFFAPIIAELERRGYSVSLTARDCFQVCALADLFRFRYRRIGRHYGKHFIMKAFGTCRRALQLLPGAWKQRPDLAVSHGSRSQLIASKLAGIPTVVICDYEFAGAVPGAAPTWVMVPEVIPAEVSGRTPEFWRNWDWPIKTSL